MELRVAFKGQQTCLVPFPVLQVHAGGNQAAALLVEILGRSLPADKGTWDGLLK